MALYGLQVSRPARRTATDAQSLCSIDSEWTIEGFYDNAQRDCRHSRGYSQPKIVEEESSAEGDRWTMGRVLRDVRRVFGPRQRMKECTDELAESTAISEPSTRQNPFTNPVTDAITITPTPSARNYDSMGVSRNPEDLLKTNETEWTVEQIVARIAELEDIEQYSTPQFPYMTKRMTKRMTKYHAMVPKDGLSVSEVLKQKEQAEQLRTREEELAQFLQELEKNTETDERAAPFTARAKGETSTSP